MKLIKKFKFRLNRGPPQTLLFNHTHTDTYTHTIKNQHMFSTDLIDIANPNPPVEVTGETVTLYYGANDFTWNYDKVAHFTFAQLLTEQGSCLGLSYNPAKTTIRKEDAVDEDEGFETKGVSVNDLITPGVYNVNVGTDSKGIS